MKDKKWGIEYVCTANGGRSPMAEVAAKKQIEELGLESRIMICSSGSHYEVLQEMEMPFDYLMSNLELGLKRGFYNSEQKKEAEKILQDKDQFESKYRQDLVTREVIKDLAKIPEMILTEEEEDFRDLVLEEVGLRYIGTEQQYQPREGVQIVLPMKDSNAARVRELSDSNRPQIIVPIREYAGLEGDIPNPFGKGIEIWRETRDSIFEAAKASIEKVANKYL
jgi:protein-tyrosine-phosphatase